MNKISGPAIMLGDMPYRQVNLAKRSVITERRSDGSILLRSPVEIGPVCSNFCEYLRFWARESPDRPFLRQRVGPWRKFVSRDWRTVTYGEAYRTARSIAQALLDRGFDQQRPILILSPNSIEQALIKLAGMMVGIPVAPVSPAYSLLSKDLGKIRYIAELLGPAAVFVQRSAEYRRAVDTIRTVCRPPVEIFAVETANLDLETAFLELTGTVESPSFSRAWDRVGADTVAKYLFTSGSTGMPKAVPNTHGMLCANQAMLEWAMPADKSAAPVALDWLPWNHTFGGNLVFNSILRQGGVLHIDEGRPLAEQFDETLENLHEVSPTHMWNVPSAFSLLTDALEQSEELRRKFFSKLKLMFYGGAGLPQSVWDRLQKLAIETIGERIVFICGFGSTETGPMATLLHWPVDGPGRVGLPLPGATVKLVPSGERYEIRLKGPMVFPGYHGRPDLTAEAMDEEGFYRIGDAGRLVDPERPEEGIQPDGRIVEDFKLQTGSFVRVGRLRLKILSEVPELQDVVIAGQDQRYIGLLAWLNLATCRQLTGKMDVTSGALIQSPVIVQHIIDGITRYNQMVNGSSERIQRVLLLDEPPSIDENEITDKGYVNQRAVLSRRQKAVADLFADLPPQHVIVLPE